MRDLFATPLLYEILFKYSVKRFIEASFTDGLRVGEEVNCVGEMFGHHVRSKCEIGRTYSKFGRTMSDDRLLFPALYITPYDVSN